MLTIVCFVVFGGFTSGEWQLSSQCHFALDGTFLGSSNFPIILSPDDVENQTRSNHKIRRQTADGFNNSNASGMGIMISPEDIYFPLATAN
jgi:hypothetical protein